MSAVTNFAINIISAVIVVWIAIVFYFSIEEYKTGASGCVISKDSVTKANNVLMGWYTSAKNKVEEQTSTPSGFYNMEKFEERELNPHPFNYTSGEEVENTETEPEEQDYNEVLMSQLEPIVFEQHSQYVKENNRTTTGASTKVERSDREEVVPTWGLRRVNYGKDILSKNALTVPSFEYEAEKTTSTNLMDILGA